MSRFKERAELFIWEWKPVFICFAMLIGLFVILFAIGTVYDKTHPSHIYTHPGVCEVCGTKLAKTVYSSTYTSRIVWYCPNPDCSGTDANLIVVYGTNPD